MAKVLVYEDENGVKVVVPVLQPGQNEARALELAALPVLGRAPMVIDSKAVPVDRDYRAAWAISGNAVVEDLVKARQVAMGRCRAQRDAKLAASDGAMLKAQETGTQQDVNAMKTKRQALRDLPATIQAQLDAATTMAALRSVDLTGGL